MFTIDRRQEVRWALHGGREVGGFPVLETYGLAAPYRFTGRIDRVTIDLKEMKAAVMDQADAAREEASARKALLN